jgi:alanine racemase
MLINGKKASLVGRVCMDQLMLDVSDIEDVKCGDIVTVIGEQGGERITADDVARIGGTINYEVVCDVGERVPRFYLRNGKIVAVKDNIIPFDVTSIDT